MENIQKILKSLHRPKRDSHKGQNGKLLIIGGSVKYSGSPIFEILAARRFVDLLFFYPAENDPFLVQAAKNIPEAIVTYDLEKIEDVDCVLFGSGMPDAEFDVSLLSKANKVVVDADGFKYVGKEALGPKFILTPHTLEFERYFGIPASGKNVVGTAQKHKCTILKKGIPDIMSDGKRTMENNTHNQGMTKGGTGDVLAGLTAALACTNPNFEAAAAAAYVNGLAGNMLLKKYGYNYCASDLANALAEAHFAATK
jgi:ADP-dependent NAD(P)H-hydrate dehydratase / NAD(P)H-hydrate epimerase